jgi:UDP-N-acetylmuramoylalanine--D-glutamate ligase
VVGNVGLACLDGLDDSSIDVYVLELSSFQLETTDSLKPAVATVLNVSEDHMDRYDSFDDYAAVKRSVYRGAAMAVVNANDQQTVPDDKSVTQTNVSAASNMGNTTGNSAIKADWSLRPTTDGAVILQGPNNIEVDASALQVDGSHNQYNALVSMALVKALFNSEQNLPASISELRGSTAALSRVFANGLKRFTGLPHRTQLVRHSDGVSWFNDSKGTNVGACVSAIEGLTGPVVLIAGGQGKGADFSPLAPAIAAKCRAVILIGEDADKLHRAIGDPVPVYQESTLADAVDRAATVAQTGDSVLLSPACASFDMFANFEARGDAFADEVNRLCA